MFKKLSEKINARLAMLQLAVMNRMAKAFVSEGILILGAVLVGAIFIGGMMTLMDSVVMDNVSAKLTEFFSKVAALPDIT